MWEPDCLGFALFRLPVFSLSLSSPTDPKVQIVALWTSIFRPAGPRLVVPLVCRDSFFLLKSHFWFGPRLICMLGQHSATKLRASALLYTLSNKGTVVFTVSLSRNGNPSWVVITHAFNPSKALGNQRQVHLLRLRPIWFTEWILSQPGLHRQTLSQENNKTNKIRNGSTIYILQ